MISRESFKPTIIEVAERLLKHLPHRWELLAASSQFSMDYMDHEECPQTVVFGRDALHIAEQLWATSSEP